MKHFLHTGLLASVLVAVSTLAAQTLRDIAPVQVYPVQTARPVPAVPLTAQEAPADSWDLDLSLNAFFDRGQGLAPQSRPAPLRYGGHTTAGVFNRRSTWLSGLPSAAGWRLGSENWRYGGARGLGLTIGNEWSDAPVWGSAVRLGGLHIARAPGWGVGGAESWGYSFTLGALDYSGDPGTEGDLIYGPVAGVGTLQFEVDPALTLESQFEMAPEMVAGGVGARYKTEDWGSWTAGVARATNSLYGGWSYQTGYEVEVLHGLRLSWLNQRRSPGFSDLAHYRDFSMGRGLAHTRWDATVPLGRWGELMGTYDIRRAGTGEMYRSVGLGQQFWLSPNLRVSLTAGRAFHSGDYDIGLGLSVPLF